MTWYTGNIVYDTVLLAAFILVGLTIIGGFFVKTPYGRFGSDRLGLSLSPRLGWFLMEFPSTLVFLLVYFRGERPFDLMPLVFLAIWCIHYANRGFAFPFLIRVDPGYRQTFNLAVVASGWLVTSMHGYLNASFFTTFGKHFTTSWLTDPRFIIGICIYYSGYFSTIYSERILRNLRPKDPTKRAAGPRYRIPEGGLFKLVTNAHYLSELTAWAGFAIMTWSLAGLFIFLISASNLVPRARLNQKWYLKTFDNYPKDRKILIPFIW